MSFFFFCCYLFTLENPVVCRTAMKREAGREDLYRESLEREHIGFREIPLFLLETGCCGSPFLVSSPNSHMILKSHSHSQPLDAPLNIGLCQSTYALLFKQQIKEIKLTFLLLALYCVCFLFFFLFIIMILT